MLSKSLIGDAHWIGQLIVLGAAVWTKIDTFAMKVTPHLAQPAMIFNEVQMNMG